MILFKKIVIASHNTGKIKEIETLLMPLGVEVLTAQALGLAEPEETGTTFIQNAKIKATTITRACQLPSLADDSGLVIPALNGDPGIYSARWAEKTPGGPRDFAFAIEQIGKLLNYQSGVPAYMVCALSLTWPDGRCHNFEGTVEGTLQFPPRGAKGFGYDPIFQPSGYTLTFGEMDPPYKHSISHRAQAFAQLTTFLCEQS